MQGDTRQTVNAILVALAVLLIYQFVVNRFFPPPKTPAATQPAPAEVANAPTQDVPGTQPTTSTAGGSTGTAAGGPGTTAGSTGTAAGATGREGMAGRTGTTEPAAAERAYFTSAPEATPVQLGGRDGDALRIMLEPRGAALATLELFAKKEDGRFVHRSGPKANTPYQLLSPVPDPGTAEEYYSYATNRLRLDEPEPKQSWALHDLKWRVIEADPEHAVFGTELRDGGRDADQLRIRKTYQLRPGKPIFDIKLQFENAGPAAIKFLIEQDGPVGIHEEPGQTDMRRLLVAQATTGSVELAKGRTYAELQEAALDPQVGVLPLLRTGKGPLVWTALTNKYFAAYTRPVPLGSDFQEYVVAAQGTVLTPHAVPGLADPFAHGDLLARLVTKPTPLGPGGTLEYTFEIYVGPKDAEHVRAANPLYADKTKLYYQLAVSADGRCFCSFMWLEEIMVWLLESIYRVVGNYGIAIMILVVIVRTLLHPLAVFQQKSMYRMQEAMARIHPQMDAIKQRHANDKVKQNQEIMRLFADEGVNPASQFIAFVPLFLQMPILIALWTALSSDVHLRHAPFDSWWITDLSAPDALIHFDSPIYIPLLSWFMGPIASFNVLPIVMGLSMYLQQKYMPKPAVAQKPHGTPEPPAGTRRSGGMTPEEQLRQQQIMGYMMTVLFPLMFYKMPSGLNLYWLSTNVFGIAESLIIRRQLAAEKKRREQGGPPRPKPKKNTLISRFFRHVAEQAEQLQKKADELSREEGTRKPGK